MEKYEVRDAGNPQCYFISIPNIVDDTKLSVHAFRLYVHYKRVAGDNGKCWQSTRTLAEHCNMSIGTVSKARKELAKANLINITIEKNEQGGKPKYVIEIQDIWPKNMAKYSPKTTKLASSPDEHTSLNSLSSSLDEQTSSLDEQTSSPDEIKKNIVKKNTVKKNNTVEEEFENLNTNPKTEPLDKDAYLERIATATAGGIVNETSKIMALQGIDLSKYPEDVRPILETLVNCWNIRPPRHSKKSNGQYAQWVSDGRELLDACGEFGVEAIVSFRSEYDKYMDEHNGLAPFRVNGPGSLVKSIRGHAAVMRQPVVEENPYKGYNMVSKGGKRIL